MMRTCTLSSKLSMGETLRVNYVIDPRVAGRVTFRAVAPVPIEKVRPLMEVILKLNGIGVLRIMAFIGLSPLVTSPRDRLRYLSIKSRTAKQKISPLYYSRYSRGSKPSAPEKTSPPARPGYAPAAASSPAAALERLPRRIF